MNKQFSITLINNISEVSRLADKIDEFCSENKITPSSSFEINLVMDEIIANVIMHGYTDDNEHFINIDFVLTDKVLFGKIEDDGIEFNPLKSTKDDRKKSLEEKQIGGLGIHIIKEYVDKVEYNRENNKNKLTFYKTMVIE